MKFGGTSVAEPEDIKRAARRIVAAREGGSRVVAVLSARGKTTDDLDRMAHEVSDVPAPREMDMLLSVGERISCALCAMAINDLGHHAESLTGSQAGIVTDSSHTKAKILDVRADRISKALEADRIVLVAGFQGVSGDSLDVTTLGRGGSDTTAVALAAALEAEVCEIYTDVAGVFSADPRIVPEARKLPVVSFEEMLEMSASGAGVLQLRSVEYARNYGVRIHCRSSFEEGPGTLVTGEDETMERPLVTAVTHSDDEARVTLTGVRDEPGIAGAIFSALADAEVNVDMIIQNEPVSDDQKADLSFTVAALGAPRSPRGDRIAGRGRRGSDRRADRQGLDRRRRHAQPPRRRREGLPHARGGGHQHRDDLHLADQDLLRDRRRPGARGGPGAAFGVRARRGRDPARGPGRRTSASDFTVLTTTPAGESLLSAVGGRLGIAETTVPFVLFAAIWAANDREVGLAAAVAVGIAFAFAGARIVRGESPQFALSGAFGVGIAAIVASTTGRAEDFFLPGILLNAASATAFLISILAGRPLLGYIATPLLKEESDWHSDPAARALYARASWIWVGVFSFRLAVQLPLYLTGAVGPLAIARVIAGPPLFALGLWLSYLVLRPRFDRLHGPLRNTEGDE